MLNDSDVMRRKVRALGKTVPPKQDDLKDLEHFLCTLLWWQRELKCKPNKVQHVLQESKPSVPPTFTNWVSTTVLHHFKRANYQTYIWKNALQATIPMQEPEGEGGKVTDGHLEIVWTAPDGVIELVCCGCKGTCATRGCSCLKIELPCTEACSCQEDCDELCQWSLWRGRWWFRRQ